MSTECRVDNLSGTDKRVRISGRISENTKFPALDAWTEIQTLQIDLEAVEQINSCGVREWIRFVSLARRSVRSLELVRCSPAMVRQLNMISNFSGGGSVRSVMLPYYCADCGHEERRLLELSGSQPAKRIEQVLPCPACGSSAEFDDLPEDYLRFNG